MKFFKRAVGITGDVNNTVLTTRDIEVLDEKSRPTFLLSINKNDSISNSITDYLKIGEKMGLPDRPLIKQRNPWYKMEQRQIPPILFTYLGRRNTRFIKNQAGVIPLTGFLCIYPNRTDLDYINNLWLALNHPDTLNNLQLVGKTYGSGAIKVEPTNLRRLAIPEYLVTRLNL